MAKPPVVSNNARIINEKDLPAIVTRLQNGAPLIGESKALGFSHNGPLRDALRKHLGMPGYDALMSAKRPVMRAPRAAGAVDDAAAPYIIDDSGVPVIFATPTREGWAIRYPQMSPMATFVAPDGTQYVRARDNAAADLNVDLTEKGYSRVRLRKARGGEKVEFVRVAPAALTEAAVDVLAAAVKVGVEAVPAKAKKPLKASAKKSNAHRGSK